MKPITSKENKPLMYAMQEVRRSSAASPHRNRKKYTRKAKHKRLDK